MKLKIETDSKYQAQMAFEIDPQITLIKKVASPSASVKALH